MAWSHGSRFELARKLAGTHKGGRLLDYGCGDGTFVAMVHREFGETVGVDVDPRQIAECVRRLGHLPGVRFGTVAETNAAGRGQSWDVVTCMEVLEHCVEEERRRVVGALARLVAPDGVAIVSVPIEIGPSVAGKQFFRLLAGLRRLGDYEHRERYSPSEMLRAVFARRVPRVLLTGVGPDGPYRYYGHKGFDYRELERELAARFTIASRLFTPIRFAGPLSNSQVWFVCRPA